MAKESKDAKIRSHHLLRHRPAVVVSAEPGRCPHVDALVDDDSLHSWPTSPAASVFKPTTSDKLNQIYASLGQQIGYDDAGGRRQQAVRGAGRVLAVLGAAGALVLVPARP